MLGCCDSALWMGMTPEEIVCRLSLSLRNSLPLSLSHTHDYGSSLSLASYITSLSPFLSFWLCLSLRLSPLINSMFYPFMHSFRFAFFYVLTPYICLSSLLSLVCSIGMPYHLLWYASVNLQLSAKFRSPTGGPRWLLRLRRN